MVKNKAVSRDFSGISSCRMTFTRPAGGSTFDDRSYLMKTSVLLDAIIFLLILLFAYTAFSKLMDFTEFSGQMHRQQLPSWTETILIYTLPGIELLTAALLFHPAYRRAGLVLAGILMLLFTVYIGAALAGVFPQKPCSCGGVFRHMGWKSHFLFNIFFLLLTFTGLYITYRERRIQQKR